MGVNLTPIIIKQVLTLENLRGKSFAVDANNYLYQFLAMIRMRDGTPLQDSHGNVTSHLAGLLFRSTRLMSDYNIDLVFAFDGKPPSLKQREIAERREVREKAAKEWQVALAKGDFETAFSRATVSSRLTSIMIEDSKMLLRLLGIPYVQASAEAEAQCAYIAMKGETWAASSKDYDSLLFGAPRMARYLTISGHEFLPSKGISRPLKPELIELDKCLSHWRINREQFIDLAILVGTDFNEGIKGIGPKKALKLLQNYGRIENIPDELGAQIQTQDYERIRQLYLKPDVTDDYRLEYGQLQEEGLYSFLCGERDFSTARVETAIRRMKHFYARRRQTGLEAWLGTQ